LLILFIEIPAGEEPKPRGVRRKSLEARSRADGGHEVARLQEELRSTKESLQTIIQEQEGTNEELKSANEEIQSSNEELQSTNEELETAKEELQSTNEELTTLNEELQNRNVELNHVNNDLNNLLSSVSMPIVMLGNDLTVRRFTPLGERFFNLIPTDVGRRISDINPNIQVSNLDQKVAEVIETLKVHEREIQDRDGRWYSLRIRPYRTSDHKIEGAVILLVDIDEIKRGLDEFVELTKQPLMVLRGDLRVEKANEAFYRTFQTTAKETENSPVYQLGNGQWNNPALRTLLEGVLPEQNRVNDFRVEHAFPRIGKRTMLFSARRLRQSSKGTHLILVSIDDVTEQSRSRGS